MGLRDWLRGPDPAEAVADATREWDTRATLASPPEWLITALSGGSAYSGEPVTLSSSLTLAPFYRGVNILANAFAQSPLKVYRDRANGEREEARSTRGWDILHDKPNPNMAADEYWAIVEFHLETWGNHFAYKERSGDGRVAYLWPLNPSRVQVTRVKDGTLRYIVDGNTEILRTSADILHIRALSLDGVVGYSAVQQQKHALGTALARQKFIGKFWANDATPGVVLIHPNKLDQEQAGRLRAMWNAGQKGVNRAGETAVISDDIKIHQMTMPLADAQFIEQERASRTEQALLLGLPPYMLAGESGGDSLTYSTTEAHSLDLLKWTIGPRMVRVQSCVTQDPDLTPSHHFCEFVTDAILRATTKERREALGLALWMTVDEVRGIENLPALGGDNGAKLIAELKRSSASSNAKTNEEGEPSE